MSENERAWRAYERDYERRRNEILTKLKTIKNSGISPTHQRWLNQAIQFIKEQRG